MEPERQNDMPEEEEKFDAHKSVEKSFHGDDESISNSSSDMGSDHDKRMVVEQAPEVPIVSGRIH